MTYEWWESLVQLNLSELWRESDTNHMKVALELAAQAQSEGEVPVGAVVVFEGRIIGEGRNRPISSRDPTSHAEIEALRCAASRLENYRLPLTTLYVTVEPCIMCAGAILLARVDRLVFGARDIRFGAVRSKFSLLDSELLNHRVRVEEGLFAPEAAALLAGFFRERRRPKR